MKYIASKILNYLHAKKWSDHNCLLHNHRGAELLHWRTETRVDSSVTSEIPVHHKNHLQFWTYQHLLSKHQTGVHFCSSRIKERKNLLKGSSTYNNCTVLNIKYFRSVCFKNKLVCFQNSWKEFCWSFFLTPIKYVWVFIDKNSWDSTIHITHALLPNSHYTLTLAKGLSGEKKKAY